MHEGLLGQLSVSDEDSATEHIESGQVLVRVLVPVPQVTEQLDHSPQAPVIFIISQKYLLGFASREFPPGKFPGNPEFSFPVSREIFLAISREIREIF